MRHSQSCIFWSPTLQSLISKVVKKVRRYNFNLCAHSYLHIDTCTNMSYWGNWQILAIWILDVFYCCSLYQYQSFMRYRGAKIELQKKWAQKNYLWMKSPFLLSPHYTAFYHFFVHSLPTFQGTYFLNDSSFILPCRDCFRRPVLVAWKLTSVGRVRSS